MNTLINTKMNDLLDSIGLISFVMTIFLKLSEFLLGIEWNSCVTFLLTISALIFTIFKIKDVRLAIKIKEEKLY